MTLSDLWPFKRKPRTSTRYVVGTGREKKAAQRQLSARKTSIMAELAVYAATTTTEQRLRETEAFFAEARKRARG